MSNLSRSSAAVSACTLLFTLFSAALCAGQAAPQTLENPSLRVTVDPQAGTLDVLDKASGQHWFSAHTRKSGSAPRFRDR